LVLAVGYTFNLSLTWPELTISIMAVALLVAYATRHRAKP